MQIHRHPCGFFFSQAFADFLAAKVQEESPHHPEALLAIEYLRCRDGAQAGSAWCEINWVPAIAAPAANRLSLAGQEVVMSRQTLNGLTGQMLHYSGGQVVIKR